MSYKPTFTPGGGAGRRGGWEDVGTGPVRAGEVGPSSAHDRGGGPRVLSG